MRSEKISVGFQYYPNLFLGYGPRSFSPSFPSELVQPLTNFFSSNSTMDFGKDKFDITKLNGENYGSWKYKVRLVLIHRRLWEAVVGTDDYTSKIKKDLAVIGLSVS